MQAVEKKTQDVDLESLPPQLPIMPRFLLGPGTESPLGWQPLAFFLHLLAFPSLPFITSGQICSALATRVKICFLDLGPTKRHSLNAKEIVYRVYLIP